MKAFMIIISENSDCGRLPRLFKHVKRSKRIFEMKSNGRL